MAGQSTRRIGTEDSATRHALLDAAQRLMVEQGYASVTSRKVAARAGLKPQLVHYYFRTMDDLFIALVRRGAEANRERQQKALASAQPLRELWELSIDPAGARLNAEFFALSNHRKVIRAELAALGEQFRRLQVEALTGILAGSGADVDGMTPEAAAVLITSVSQILVMEAALGVGIGHAEMRALVDRWISRYDAALAGIR